MQLLEDFWAFCFELTNSHLFQQNLMPALHDNDITVNFTVNAVVNSNWSCLLISAPKVNWRVQPTAARRSSRFNKMHGALRALHVSLNNASTRTVRKWLKRNNVHLITLQIWMDWRYRILERRRKLFWNHPYPKTVSELKVALNKIWDSFS